MPPRIKGEEKEFATAGDSSASPPLILIRFKYSLYFPCQKDMTHVLTGQGQWAFLEARVKWQLES
jgi:hypothetical protein